MTKFLFAAAALLFIADTANADWYSRNNSYREARQSRQRRTETYLFPQRNRMIIAEDVGGGNFYIQDAPITVYGQGYGQQGYGQYGSQYRSIIRPW